MEEEFEVTPEMQAWFDKEAKGLKDQNEKLIGEKRNWVKTKAEIEAKNAEILEKMENDEQRKLYETGNIEEAFNRKYHSTISKKEDSIRSLESEKMAMEQKIERMQIDNIARQAALDAGVKPNAVNMVAKSIGEQYKIKDGRLIGYDETGQEMLNSKGDPKHIRDAIAEMATTDDYLFVDAAGSGSRGHSSSPLGQRKSKMTTEQKSEFVEKYGADKFMALPS